MLSVFPELVDTDGVDTYVSCSLKNLVLAERLRSVDSGFLRSEYSP